jgi:hypothetical protein
MFQATTKRIAERQHSGIAQASGDNDGTGNELDHSSQAGGLLGIEGRDLNAAINYRRHSIQKWNDEHDGRPW